MLFDFDSLSMKLFLINLDACEERLAAADGQLRRLGVAYERFPAVYGAALSPEARRRAVDRFRWWCAVGRPVRNGEIGCALSHYAIYRRMAEEGMAFACVLEDDVVLDARFPEQLARVERWLDASAPQVVLLSNHTREWGEAWEFRPAAADMYTEGYVLTLPAARALLRANLPMQTPCDHWGRWVRRGVIQLYHAFPTVCSQDQRAFVSGTVSPDAYNVRRLSRGARLFHDARRAVGKAVDNLLLAVGR